jgi:hypothetical protein
MRVLLAAPIVHLISLSAQAAVLRCANMHTLAQQKRQHSDAVYILCCNSCTNIYARKRAHTIYKLVCLHVHRSAVTAVICEAVATHQQYAPALQ